MKSTVAAATIILAASALALPSFGQKRGTAVAQPAAFAAKHHARKPVNLPRNKAPPHKAAHPSKPKKGTQKPKDSTKQPAKPAAKPTTADNTTTDVAAPEEKEVASDDKTVNAEDKTIEHGTDREVSGAEHDTDMDEVAAEHDTDEETTAAEHEHVPRANKPQPKKAAPKPKPASKPAAKPAKKPATKPASKPAQKSTTDEVEDEGDDEVHDAEGEVSADPETIEPTEEVEHEEDNVGKVHARAQAKVNGSKPKPKSTAQHAGTQPKKAASQPKKAASTGKTTASTPKEKAQGAPFAQISTVEKTVTSKVNGRRAAKKAAHKSPAKANTPVTTVSDDTPANAAGIVVKTAGGKLHARDSTPTDVQILQYALVLEHLENAFYKGALEKFNQQAFVQGGLPSFARKRFEQIAEHEAEHVAFLTSALGDQAVEACEYDFPYTDPKSFAALSMVLEGVGVSAYLGAAQFIQNKAYLTAAGAILTTESRHAAWVASAVEKDAPWSGAFDTPLSFDDVYSLATPFITSCPSSNPALPFKAFPKLTVTTEEYKAGDTITLDFDDSEAKGEPTFLALFNGLNTTYIPIEDNTKATLPSDLEGTVYGVISTNGTAVNDENTIAGVAVLSFYANY